MDKLFAQYEEIKDGADDSEKEKLVAQICDALTVHAQIEEDDLLSCRAPRAHEEEARICSTRRPSSIRR